MTAPVRALRPDQPADAPDAPGVAFSAWNYGHELARSGVPAKLGAGPCAVLHTLASHANKQAQAEVGFGCLARETGLCRGAVIKAIARLIECRAIGRLQRRDEDTMVNAVNLYTIFPIEGIIAHPAPARRREQARALARSRQESRQAEGGSQRTVTSSEHADPSDGVLTTPSDGVLTTPSERTVTRVVNTREPKASPLSVPLLSIPNKHPSCAPNGTPPVPPAASSAHATSNGKATKRRERKMSDEEKADVEAAITHFNVRLRPVVDDEYGRFIRESLAGIRGFGLNHFCRTIDFMATNPRFVSDPYVTPLTVTKTVPIWEDNGQPTRWQQLDDRKKRLALKGRS